MTPAPACSSPAEPAADRAATLLERQLAMLDELAEIAMDVARSVGRQASEAAAEGQAGTKGADLALAFSRAARAVRLTLLLQTRLVEGPAGGSRGRAIAPVSREARMARAQDHIERLVREEHGADAEAVERLVAEGAERLAEEECFDEMSMGEIVALICNDLQLQPDRVARARGLFDVDDERLPPPVHAPGDVWELLWPGDPPRPRRRRLDEAERATGPPLAPAAALD